LILRRTAAIALSTILLILCVSTRARADPITQVLDALNVNNVYISDLVYQHHEAQQGDEARLQAAVDAANNQGVAEKIALLQRFPSNIHTAAEAATNIGNFEDFTGVVIVVWPHGVGLSTDPLTDGEAAQIAREVAPYCTGSFTTCATAAADRVIPVVKSEKSNAYRSAAIFWVITLAILGVVIGGVVLFFRRRTAKTIASLGAFSLPTEPSAPEEPSAGVSFSGPDSPGLSGGAVAEPKPPGAGS
jgi:hypothetical protein